MEEFTNLEKVCFVVSPQNPLKKKQNLLDQYHRLMIIRMELEDNPKLEVSDIEKGESLLVTIEDLPIPSAAQRFSSA